MKKPEEKIVKHLDYNECEKYIAHKLGIKDLRDVLGKFGNSEIKEVGYQDFWHVVMDHNDGLINGSYIYISTDWFQTPEWAKPILKTFAEEFGENQEYWVEW